jgi:TolB-like protein
MSEVFISYARSSANEAEAMAQALRALGYGVWRDDELPAHRDYSEVIEERLRGAKAVVVLWSADAVKSQWVRAEADVAREAGTLVQLSLDGAGLPLPFNRIQCADLKGWSGGTDHAGWRKVVASIAQLAGASPEALTPASQAAPSSPLLAVLAFDNLSGDPDMAYFSDGLSEEILDAVARGAGLRVIARSSSFQFRGADKAVRKVASELRATHLLDGSVRRAGGRVRISAQLVDCTSGTAVWSNRFEGDLADVFALQDEIAEAVAEALKGAFAPQRPLGRIDPKTYELYLRAKDQGVGAQNVGLALEERVGLLEKVVREAPEFAAGWAWLGQMRALQAAKAERGPAFKRKRAAALESLERAIALDPQLPTPFLALNQLEPLGAYAKRWGHVRKSLEVAPEHADSLALASHFAFTVGWVGESLAYGRHAYELDPLHPMAAQSFASAVWCSGDVEGARRLLLGFREARPKDAGLNLNLINMAIVARDWAALADAEAFAHAHGHMTEPTVAGSLKFGDALRTGDPTFAERVLRRMNGEIERTGAAPVNQLVVLCQLGLVEEAFEAVERSDFAQIFDEEGGRAAGDYNPGMIFNRPSNSAMMFDPRFVRLCAKLGYVAFWRETGRWPDCAGHVLYDFRAEAERLAG